jgi:Ca2+-binding RTX toxin-like protein
MTRLAIALAGAPVLALLAVPAPAPAADTLTCQYQTATIVAAPGAAANGTPGADVIVGLGNNTIDAGGGDDVLCIVSGHVTTGDGSDSVDIQPGGPEATVVDLGTGRDRVRLTAGATTNLTLTADAAVDDDLTLGTSDASYVVDLAAGTLAREGATVGHFSGFDTYTSGSGPDGRVELLGTEGNDDLLAFGNHVDADLRGGNDRIEIVSQYAGGDGSLQGGAGDDTLRVFTVRSLTLDLRVGTVAVTNKLGRGSYHVAGFEGYGGVARKAHVDGSFGDDDVSIYGCRVTMRGSGGNDDLELSPDNEDAGDAVDCHGFHANFRGGPGNDLLVGRRLKDVLLGGQGRDEAIGHGGGDVCQAEKEKSC